MKVIKWLAGGVALVVVLLIVLVIVCVMAINSLARKGIEAGGTYALGVPTTLSSASVGLTSGTFSMSGLKVANPGGFNGPHFMTLGQGGVALSLATLNQDTVELPSLSLDSIDVRLERKGDSANYKVILDNLSKLSSGSSPGGGKPAPPSGGGEKKFVIKDLSIRNVTVHLDLLGVGGAAGAVLGEATKITIPIDEIKLQNVGKTGTGVAGSGASIGQLASIIVQAVLGAAVEKGGGVIPGDVLGDLKGRLANLDGLKGLGMGVAAKAQAQVEQLGKQAEKAAGDAVNKGKEAAEKAAKDAAKKGIEGLIPGKKKEAPK